ncbi:DUF4153 domain-containing protein [Roseospira navarrensis]|uniref:DUF4153 domain-containing protein n=1 Tax=Roseospira navarrensis TaxID=140058 RepID=A0A7X1ZGG6_9PROT|nr:DUF4153 domain-containing protein [Roseospira navarrensis]MQX36795.1 DUF4153 domain-containing protein [Roseospira navarrensis]
MTPSTPLSAIVAALASQPSTWISAARAVPVAVACAVLGTLLGIWMVLGVPDVLALETTIALMTCGIGFFAALAMDWGLRRQGWWPRPARVFGSAVVIIVAGATLYAIPDHPDARLFPYIYWQAGAILMALYYALRPPKEAPEEKAHLIGWYAGERVLVSAAMGWGLATLLGGGIVVALLACDELLGLPVATEVYEIVWVLAYGIVWPMAFLVGATQAMPEEDHERPAVPERTPRWIAVAVTWALIPLALLYMAILYVYLVQIVLGVATDWGSIAALNAAYLGFGVGAHMAALPLARQGNWFAAFYRRVFPWTVPLPLLALAWAVWIRLFEYGITEARGLLIIAVIWLVLLCVAWLLKGQRAGPATPVGLLGILLVLGAQGPWGAPELSFLSQERALRGLLDQHGMLEDGRAVPAEDEVPKEDQRRLVHLLTYFHERGTNYRIAELFPDGEITAASRARALDLDVPAAMTTQQTLHIYADGAREVVPVSGFDTLVTVSFSESGERTAVFEDVASVTLDGTAVTVTLDGAEDSASLTLDLTPVIAAAFAAAEEDTDGEADRIGDRSLSLPRDVLTVETEGGPDGASARLAVETLRVRHDGVADGATLSHVSGTLLIARP